ncbi:TPA: hypothetical protein PTV68_002041 [Clostridium botulinum]|uniref:hypothetical protein n=1 Tax=Clostridium botulinum TaxID=1491 RepID=UPI0029ABFB45|nr:hypothetical protein [Clostridium botulinum]HDK7188705.1 hypothetical protein [Clostridium botulinum]HDK7215624.1 hypothetical protein [Clostridium botulinum]HDK7231378.1 hypothetical protein [Clostridium botulinum]HDK7260736.1 hypothetical protein [Clostridium botulinum]
MGLFSRKNKEINPINLIYIDGIDRYIKRTTVSLSLDDKKRCLVIKASKGNYPVVNISFEKLVAVDIIHERDIIETNKNSVGRAMAGGILLGPLGAIIGGISGVGSKKNSELRTFLVINYKSKDEEIKVISFEIKNITLSMPKFINKLRENIPINNDEEIYL